MGSLNFVVVLKIINFHIPQKSYIVLSEKKRSKKDEEEGSDFHFVQSRCADVSHASLCTSICRFFVRWFSLSRLRCFVFSSRKPAV